MSPDPFGTAAIRGRVLDAWAASPARFREDANAEEDLALGGYRDRLVVELAQNAADAAALAGVPGRLLLSLGEHDGRPALLAANTGAALDAAGVQALCTLRASAKRDDDVVGRFGVGFAAVLAVTDAPAVRSRAGGVRFSAEQTRRLVTEAGGELAAEAARRDGHVPVLRLPFPDDVPPPDGYDTAVLLPLRDDAAAALAGRLLAGAADPLLLALPGLDEITVETPGAPPRTLRDAASRWHVLRRAGVLPPDLLADRPTEDRARASWQVTWALPRTGGPAGGVLHAPTPTDEPLPWPGLLLATFPLDPSRRHVAPGPAADALAGHAAAAYLELLAERAEDGDDAWSLLPTGIAAGALDGVLRAELAARLPAAPILRSAERPPVPVRPRDAVVLAPPAGSDPAVLEVFAPWVAGLVAAARGGSPLTAHGARELSLADLVEALPAVGDPARWQVVYAALAPLATDPLVREALAAIPVPLADGRVVRGARGAVLLEGDGSAAALALLGVRTVHPAAAHPLLERLGATPSSARAVLALPAVLAAVEESADADDPDAVADAVLGLVAAALRDGGGGVDGLGELALPDDAGDLAPAAALALPGSDAARWFDPDEIGLAAPELAERWGADVLAAAGVLTGLATLRAADVALDDEGPDLDGFEDWAEHAAAAAAAAGLDPLGAVVPELVAVRDLDGLRDDALPEAVAALAADPALRAALVAPTRVRAGGAAADVLPYTAWWLRDRLGAPLAGGGPLAGLLPAAPAWVAALDPEARTAAGVLDDVAGLDAGAVPALLERLADPAADVPPALLLAFTARLAELAAAGLEVEPPGEVRVLDGDGTAVVPAADAVVLDAPMHRQRPDLGAPLPAPAAHAAALADLLDLPLARELAAGVVATDGTRAAVPPEALALAPGAPATWCEHEELTVDGVDVAWWVDGAGDVHAATLDGLARGLAWSAGCWSRRAAIAEVLADPDALPDLLADEAF